MSIATSERDELQAEAFGMARRLADRLRDPNVPRQPQYDLPSAIRLIHNLVDRFDQPALAVEFALDFHSTVEVWSLWAGWTAALDRLLTVEYFQPTNQIRLLIFHSSGARGIHEYELANTNATTAFELATACDELTLVAKALNQLARIAFDQDEYVQAKAYLEQADVLDKTKISPYDLWSININLGNIAVQQEQFEEAHQYFDQALIYYQQQDNSIHAAKVNANRADLFRREGKLEQARLTLISALRAFQAEGARYDYAIAQNSLACIFLQSGQWNEALFALDCAIKDLDELGALATKAWVLTNIIELYVKTYQSENVEKAAAEAYELARLCNRPLVTAGVHVDYGLMLFEQGEVEKARQLWLEALTIQESHGAETLAKHTRRLLNAQFPQT